MKQSKICPKCNSHEIVRIPGQLGAYGSGNNIPMGGLTIFSSIKVTRYLCIDCGYSEEWIDDRKNLERIKTKFGGKTD